MRRPRRSTRFYDFADGWLTAAGRQIKERVETLTDDLAAPAYGILEPHELHQLIEDLEPPCRSGV